MGKTVTKWIRIGLLILFFLGLNIAGRTLSEYVRIPFRLDMLGVILAAYFLGPLSATTVGIFTKFYHSLFFSGFYGYLVIGAMLGYLAYVLMHKKMHESFTGAWSMVMILALAATLGNAALNFLYFNGTTCNVWGGWCHCLYGKKECIAAYWGDLRRVLSGFGRHAFGSTALTVYSKGDP